MLRVNFTIMVEATTKNEFAELLNKFDIRVDRVEEFGDDYVIFDLGATRKACDRLLDYLESEFDGIATLIQ